MRNTDRFPKIAYGPSRTPPYPGISVTEQDGANVYTTFFSSNLPAGKARQSMRDALKALCQKISAAQGIVGHIKCTVSEITSVATLSTTGYEVNESLRPADISEICLTAIVYGSADLTEEIAKIRESMQYGTKEISLQYD